MSIFRLLLVVLLLSIFAGAATTTNLEIKDQSPTNCPIRISGEVQLTEVVEGGKFKSFYIEHFVTFNPTEKAIVALVVVNHLATSYGPLVEETKLLEAFFAHDLEIAPGEKHVHPHPTVSGTFVEDLNLAAKPGTAHAESKVVFVQFSDGSVWGDRNGSGVQRLMRTREVISQTLKRLDEAARQGDAEFVKALAIDTGDFDVDKNMLAHLRGFQKNGGNDAIGKVRQMLEVAASRR